MNLCGERIWRVKSATEIAVAEIAAVQPSAGRRVSAIAPNRSTNRRCNSASGKNRALKLRFSIEQDSASVDIVRAVITNTKSTRIALSQSSSSGKKNTVATFRQRTTTKRQSMTIFVDLRRNAALPRRFRPKNAVKKPNSTEIAMPATGSPSS